MTTQTEAERLADELYSDRWITHGPQWGYDAAAELLRLESANTELQAEILEQCRINGMGAEREEALRAEVDRLKKALAEQPAQQEPVAWVDGATHYQPHQRAFYKRVSATEWYVWSRVEQEPLHWCKALGTSDSAHWILRQPAPVQEPEWYHFVRRGEDFFVPYEGQAPANATRLYITPQAQPAPEIAIADAYRAGVDIGIAAEREACAKVCDSRGLKFFSESPFAVECHGLAAAIRKKGNT